MERDNPIPESAGPQTRRQYNQPTFYVYGNLSALTQTELFAPGMQDNDVKVLGWFWMT